MLVGDRTGIIAEAEVHEGVMVTAPTPTTRTDIECGIAVRNIGMEVCQRRENGLIWDMGK